MVLTLGGEDGEQQRRRHYTDVLFIWAFGQCVHENQFIGVIWVDPKYPLGQPGHS